jgi:phospholipid/cholesterol/gamma-HCH transport system substrate-binding protein
MKTRTGNNIKLGVFVTLGTFFFILAIYFVGKRQNLFDSTFRVSAVFKDVSGLQEGNNVRFAGINVGIIENIVIINDTSVQVDMQIQEKVHKFIKDDSRAIIGSEGLMGNKILVITPGSSGRIISKKAFIATNTPVNMDDIMKNVKVTVDNVASLSEDLSVITNNIREGRGTIGKLFMDSTLARNIDKTVVNIRKGAGGFQENMEAAKNNILFRGYFRKKEKKEKEQAEQAEDNQKKNTKSSSKK